MNHLEFLGAYDSVTGSRTLFDVGPYKILVDCGSYQGEDKLKNTPELKLNKIAPYIDFIFLTHGHLDHCGHLPILEKNGFKGQIICTHMTAKITSIVLRDSLAVQEYNLKHKIVDKALFDEEDVTKVLSRITAVNFNEQKDIDSLQYFLVKAGHIIGAASVCLEYKGEKIMFSGDIGRQNDFIHVSPESSIFRPQHLILESTYGNRIHGTENLDNILSNAISTVIENKSVLLIPAFAVARTQVLLILLNRIMTNDLNLELPIYIDSPMAVKVTHLYQENLKELRDEGVELQDALERVKLIEFGKDHKKLNKADTPFILISSSGMLEGGKIMRYLEMYGKHENNVIAFSGFQAPGTLGHLITSGAKEIKLLGHKMLLRAQVVILEGLSAHADQNELIEFIKNYSGALKKLYLNHGDQDAVKEFKLKLETIFESFEIIDVEKNKKYEVL